MSGNFLQENFSKFKLSKIDINREIDKKIRIGFLGFDEPHSFIIDIVSYCKITTGTLEQFLLSNYSYFQKQQLGVLFHAFADHALVPLNTLDFHFQTLTLEVRFRIGDCIWLYLKETDTPLGLGMRANDRIDVYRTHHVFRWIYFRQNMAIKKNLDTGDFWTKNCWRNLDERFRAAWNGGMGLGMSAWFRAVPLCGGENV